MISGYGIAREADRETRVGPGDAFIFPPGEAHQLRNDGDVDFVYLVVADNPVGDHCYYPDSGKWLVMNPARRVLRGDPLDYFDGEE